MGRNIGPKNKIARRFGMNLGLKTNATKVARRLKQMPGVHGPKNRRPNSSSFGKQLIEKQKAKYLYGIRERQFRGYVTEATRLDGDSGLNLQVLLERRFDNVIYRLGLGVTRAQARQMVGHNMFYVNGKKMNIPSYLVKKNDVITIKETKKNKKIFDGAVERLANQDLAGWLKFDLAKLEGTMLHEPGQEDFDRSFDVKLIIEYYSSR